MAITSKAFAENTEYFEFIPKHKKLSGGASVDTHTILDSHFKLQTTKNDINLDQKKDKHLALLLGKVG